jgi:DNA-binding response OmpR family regulator
MQSVLVVEDRDESQIVVNEILMKNGYFVHHARSAFEAITVMDNFDFDLAIINASLPERAGVLFRAARARGVAALMITGDPDTIAAFEDDGTPYIARPFLVDEFLDIVRCCAGIGSAAERD